MYRFTPPTVNYRRGTDPLWGRISHAVGQAVVIYTDGRIVTTSSAPSATDDDVDRVWPGGRTYEITDAEAELLIAAGYSSNLEEVPGE